MQPASYVAICCLWLLGGLGILFLALKKTRFGFAQAFLVSAGLFSAAAGLCNGAVIVANGGRMPVETVEWSAAPVFYDSAEDQQGAFCRAIIQADDAITPSSDGGLHVDVPRPHIVHGAIAARVEEPHLAFLDDRHGVSVCGVATTYSKGDLFGALGAIDLVIGLALLLFGLVWKRLRR